MSARGQPRHNRAANYMPAVVNRRKRRAAPLNIDEVPSASRHKEANMQRQHHQIQARAPVEESTRSMSREMGTSTYDISNNSHGLYPSRAPSYMLNVNQNTREVPFNGTNNNNFQFSNDQFAMNQQHNSLPNYNVCRGQCSSSQCGRGNSFSNELAGYQGPQMYANYNPSCQTMVTSHNRGERLDVHVSDKLAKKIKAGEAIDLASIFDKDPRKMPVQDSDSESESRDKKSKKAKRLSRQDWCEAFTIYAYMRSQHEPSIAPGLFVHMSHVLELQQLRQDWHYFDITVRKLIEKGDRCWGDRCAEEMLSARGRPEVRVNASGSSNTSGAYVNSRHQDNTQNSKSEQVPKGFCVAYHKFGGCEEAACKSKWLHRCYKCMAHEQHRASACSGKKSFRSSFRDKRK